MQSSERPASRLKRYICCRATPSKAAAYPFSYIQPGQHVALIERFNKKKASITAMAPIGVPYMHHLLAQSLIVALES